jgi:DNA processing protein
MLADDEFAAWFRLLGTAGVGRGTARRLLAACGSPQGVFAGAESTLRALAGPEVAAALLRPDAGTADTLSARLADAQRWCHGGADRHVLVPGDGVYPAALLQTADPPLLLYAEGQLATLAAPALAIVGSRHATAQGLANAHAFAQALAEAGWVIVSGLALGVDAAAHEGALAAGSTLAVVGTGLDQVYPRRHAALARRIAAQGLLLSEHAPGTPALAEHFPQRNRLIAGLSRGTLVVEAALQSGSLITARLASEAGREVMAVPGSIHAPQSRGCHALIKQGAQLVESVADVLEALGAPGALGPRAQQAELPLDSGDEAPDGEAAALWQALGHDPATLDALQARTGWATAEISARLLEWELAGRVARLPGGLYQRVHHG